MPSKPTRCRACLLVLSGSALLLAGCAMQSTATGGNSFAGEATLSGRVHGGNQPIAAAVVNLYAVGTTGYGAGATLLATTTSANGTGGFSFTQSAAKVGPDSPVDATYGCPASSSLLYITTSSGDPTGAGSSGNANSHIKFIDAIGACSGVGKGFYDINEVSTVVSVAALQQYINPLTEQIGAPSTTPSSSNMARAATGIANAFALVQTLLAQSAGAVPATVSVASTLGSVTITPEAAKINTIADILAACVNTTGSSSAQCGTLLAAATPPVYPYSTNFSAAYATSPTASDTLQAALFMLQNPADAGTQVSTCAFGSATTNLACLYDAQTPSAPFIGLSSAPNDWSIGVTYGSNSVNAGGSYLINAPQFVAVDSQGDIWMVNYNTGAATTGNSVTELGPTGTPLAQVLTANLTGPAGGIAIDPAGNIWVPNYGVSAALAATVSEYTTGGIVNSISVSPGPESIVIDGQGDVFVLAPSFKGAGAVQEIAAGTSTATTIDTGLTTDYSTIAVDSKDFLWISGGGTGSQGGTTGYPAIYEFPYSPTAPHYSVSSSHTYTGTSLFSNPEGLTIDQRGDIWTFNYAQESVSYLYPVDPYDYGGTVFGTNAAMTKPELAVPDGAGNIWVTNASTTAGAVFEFASSGVIGANVSPANGLIHPYTEPYGIAVDPSGNVWYGNFNAKASAAVQAYITEIVGAAVPVVTPIAAGLPTTPGGTSYYATPPQ